MPIIYIFVLIIIIWISYHILRPNIYDNFTPNNLKFYYINLKKRPDRKKTLLLQLANIGILKENIVRIDAVSKKFGHFGCGLSHIKTLQTIMNSTSSEYVVILEDDFIWKY